MKKTYCHERFRDAGGQERLPQLGKALDFQVMSSISEENSENSFMRIHLYRPTSMIPKVHSDGALQIGTRHTTTDNRGPWRV